MKDDYGLLIASLVAIVAIVGLVILFSGAQTGNISLAPFDQYQGQESYWDLRAPDVDPCGGKNVADGCVNQFGRSGTCVTSQQYRPNDVCGVTIPCSCRL